MLAGSMQARQAGGVHLVVLGLVTQARTDSRAAPEPPESPESPESRLEPVDVDVDVDVIGFD